MDPTISSFSSEGKDGMSGYSNDESGWRENQLPHEALRNPIGGRSESMNELRITVGGRSQEFQPEDSVRIGRSVDSNIVVNDLTVSRHHAYLAWGPSGWSFHGIAHAQSFLAGKRVDQLIIDGPIELALASPLGPVVRMDPVRTPLAARNTDVAMSSPESKSSGSGRRSHQDQRLALNPRREGKS